MRGGAGGRRSVFDWCCGSGVRRGRRRGRGEEGGRGGVRVGNPTRLSNVFACRRARERGRKRREEGRERGGGEEKYQILLH